MPLQLFIDIAQPNGINLLVKDISDSTDYTDAFPSSGKASVYAHFIGIKHSSGGSFRYRIQKSNHTSPDLPTDEKLYVNNDFLEMTNPVTYSQGFVLTKPLGSTQINKFIDGIYEFVYGVGSYTAGTTLAANKKYYIIKGAVATFNAVALTIPDNSIIETTASGTFASPGEFVEIKEGVNGYETAGMFMLSADLLKDFANCLIKLNQTKNTGIYNQMLDLINAFRTAYDRTKALVIVDDYTEAVNSFTDCRAILDQILKIM